MSGHSKWATIKRHKAAVDAKRGKIFSVISKELTLAARDGGGDVEFNPRLRTLVQKAKASNMPADNVERAIKKGTGELPGVVYEENLYEGYGAGGVGFVVEVTTDNKNRSASEVRSTMSKNGGNLAGVGAVAFQFERKGQFLIEASAIDEESLFYLSSRGVSKAEAVGMLILAFLDEAVQEIKNETLAAEVRSILWEEMELNSDK